MNKRTENSCHKQITGRATHQPIWAMPTHCFARAHTSLVYGLWLLPHDHAKLVAALLVVALGSVIAQRLGRTKEIHIGLHTNVHLFCSQGNTHADPHHHMD